MLFILVFFVFSVTANSFYDVSESHKYSNAINFIASKGIVEGYSDGSYQPENILNRAELLKIVIEAVYYDEFEPYSSESCFTDVPAFKWYTKYVCFAKNTGIVVGYSDGSFKPAQKINFVEALKIAILSFGYNYEESEPWYKSLVEEAGDRNFIPLDVVNFGQYFNRGQMADLITRILKYESDELNAYLGDKTPYKVTYETINNGIDMEWQYLNPRNPDTNTYCFLYDDTQSYYYGLIPDAGNYSRLFYSESDTECEKITKEFYGLNAEFEGLCYNEECEVENPNYLIITRPIFVNTIQDFIKWKKENGYEVGVLTVEYINTIENQDNPAKNIREIIKEFSNNHDTDYFLLIGDTISGDSVESANIKEMYKMDYSWNVPSGYYCRQDIFYGKWFPESNYDYSKCIEISDLYYADFDDEAWEENEDGYIMRGIYSNSYRYNGSEFIKIEHAFSADKYSEILGEDSRSLDFETIVARIPIRNPNEFQNVFNKIKNYKPVTAFDHLADATLDNGIDEIYETSCSLPEVSEDDYAKYDSNCAQNTTLSKNILINGGISYSFQKFDLSNTDEYNLAQNLILNESNILNPFFHGSHNSISVFQNTDIDKFLNIFPAWISASCLIGTFSVGNDDSLSEYLIKGNNGPAFVIHPTNQYYFYKDLMAGKTVGEAFYNVNKTISRYTAVSNNLFGDPSLKIFGSKK